MKLELNTQGSVALHLVPETPEEAKQLDRLQAELLANKLEPIRWACSQASAGLPLTVGLQNRNWHGS